jgi:DNA-binding winged helix-turn-helix (wHTH) protein
MQVLLCLVAHAGEVVAKEELIRRVWTDTFVTDDVLTHSIYELRKAFSDQSKEPRYIQTIPRSGYRLIAKIEKDLTTPISNEEPSIPKGRISNARSGSDVEPVVGLLKRLTNVVIATIGGVLISFRWEDI